MDFLYSNQFLSLSFSPSLSLKLYVKYWLQRNANIVVNFNLWNKEVIIK